MHGGARISLYVHKGAPWGVCLPLFVFVRGFFVANTHFITLTLIKNTWPYSRGQSVHKSAPCSAQPLLSKALRLLLLRSQHPGLCTFNCGAALGGITAAHGAAGAHPFVNALYLGRLLTHTHTLHTMSLRQYTV